MAIVLKVHITIKFFFAQYQIAVCLPLFMCISTICQPLRTMSSYVSAFWVLGCNLFLVSHMWQTWRWLLLMNRQVKVISIFILHNIIWLFYNFHIWMCLTYCNTFCLPEYKDASDCEDGFGESIQRSIAGGQRCHSSTI